MFIIEESKGFDRFVVEIPKTIQVEVEILKMLEISSNTFHKFGHAFICEFTSTNKNK